MFAVLLLVSAVLAALVAFVAMIFSALAVSEIRGSPLGGWLHANHPRVYRWLTGDDEFYGDDEPTFRGGPPAHP